MGMSQGHGQGVRRVGLWQLGQMQHSLDHFRDGQFLRAAVADQRLFDLSGRDFINLQARFRHGCQRGTARLAHDEGCLQILCEEKPFDRAHGGAVFGRDFAERLRDFREAPGMRPTGRAGYRSVQDRDGVGLCQFNDSVSGAAKGRIDSEDKLARALRLAGGREYRRRSPSPAAETGFKLLVLLRSDGQGLYS